MKLLGAINDFPKKLHTTKLYLKITKQFSHLIYLFLPFIHI